MTIEAHGLESCEAVLQGFLAESGAICAVVYERSGRRRATQGLTRDVDLTAIGALAAAAYASTEELARQIGEREFSVLFHQGEHDHLLVTLIDDTHLLLVVFDARTTVGLVRMCAKAAAADLATALRILGPLEGRQRFV